MTSNPVIARNEAHRLEQLICYSHSAFCPGQRENLYTGAFDLCLTPSETGTVVFFGTKGPQLFHAFIFDTAAEDSRCGYSVCGLHVRQGDSSEPTSRLQDPVS